MFSFCDYWLWIKDALFILNDDVEYLGIPGVFHNLTIVTVSIEPWTSVFIEPIKFYLLALKSLLQKP